MYAIRQREGTPPWNIVCRDVKDCDVMRHRRKVAFVTSAKKILLVSLIFRSYVIKGYKVQVTKDTVKVADCRLPLSIYIC